MCCWLSVVYIRILMSRFILFSCCIISELSFVLFRSVLYVLLTWRCVVSAFWCHIWFFFRVVSVLYYIWIVFCFISDCFVAIDDRIYPIELEIKDTTDTDRSASYLDLHLEIEGEGWLGTKLYDKRDDFNFPSWTFHAYVAAFQQHLHMEYISQLIRYSRACGSYQEFLDRGLLLTRNLLNRRFLIVKLKSSLRKFYGWLLCNICVTNDRGYVLLVVNTSRSFPRS